MKISYDPDADAAYIQLVGSIGVGGAKTTIPFYDSEPGTEVIVDLDGEVQGLLLELGGIHHDSDDCG